MNAIYLKLLTSLAILFFVLRFLTTYSITNIGMKKYYRISLISALIFIIPLIYFAWMRPVEIGDTSSYINQYQNLSINNLFSFLQSHPKDPGFTVLLWIIKNCGFDYRGMFLIIACIQAICLALFYRKYSANYFFSILLFVLSTDYISWMMNGIRQFLAVSICLLAAPFIFDKKLIKASIVFLIASTFHQSALMMIPVAFFVQGKPFNWKTTGIIIGTVLALTFVAEFTNLLDDSLQNTQYNTVVSDYTTGVFSDFDDGVNPIRVLFYSLPTILAIVMRKRIQYMNVAFINVCLNMSIISTCLYLVGMVTSGIYIGRLPIYCSLYNYVLIPWQLNNLFSENSKYIAYTVVSLLFIGFCMVSLGIL